MKRIVASRNAEQWPRHPVKNLELRKRDLTVRISDWSKIKPENGTGGFDVEVYIGGVYDWNESENFDTKGEAAAYAAKQIARLL